MALASSSTSIRRASKRSTASEKVKPISRASRPRVAETM
jgi:hypothetical protein